MAKAWLKQPQTGNGVLSGGAVPIPGVSKTCVDVAPGDVVWWCPWCWDDGWTG